MSRGALQRLRDAGYTCTQAHDGRLLVRPSAARGTYWPSGCGSIRFTDADTAARFLLADATARIDGDMTT